MGALATFGEAGAGGGHVRLVIADGGAGQRARAGAARSLAAHCCAILTILPLQHCQVEIA
jgi:hypothetical protein